MITQTTEYALRAVVCLAQAGDRRWTVRDLAAVTAVPEGYLAKVMQQLAHAGVVASQRGRHGGFSLTRPPHELSVLEVVGAVEPLPRIHRCPLGLAEHADRLCALHRRVDREMQRVEAAFAETSFADLLSEPGPHWPLGERVLPSDPKSAQEA